MDYRVLTEAERKYTFSQSQQLSMQTGLIGYLREPTSVLTGTSFGRLGTISEKT